jgi:glycosyltransferase involved in cell wall biosynthesis
MARSIFSRRGTVEGLPRGGSPGSSARPILIVGNTAWNLAHFREPIIRAFVAEGYRVVAVAMPDGSEQKLSTMGAEFVPAGIVGGSISPIDDFRFFRQLLNLLTGHNPIALLSFTIKPNVYGGLAARMKGAPFYPTISGIGSAMMASGPMSRLVSFLMRRALVGARHVVFQNRDDEALFIEKRLVDQRRTLVVPGSGVDLTHFAAVPLPAGQPFKFLMIGRLLTDKGVVELVDAIKLLRARGLTFRVRVLGEIGANNPTAVPLEVVERWIADELFTHLPAMEDVRPAIAAADCVILPSYREGLPRSLLEAAAMARPLIATDVPGCRDLIDEGCNGFLCAARSAHSLAAAMQKMLETPLELRSAMAHASRQKVEAGYDARTVASAYVEMVS